MSCYEVLLLARTIMYYSFDVEVLLFLFSVLIPVDADDIWVTALEIVDNVKSPGLAGMDCCRLIIPDQHHARVLT